MKTATVLCEYRSSVEERVLFSLAPKYYGCTTVLVVHRDEETLIHPVENDLVDFQVCLPGSDGEDGPYSTMQDIGYNVR